MFGNKKLMGLVGLFVITITILSACAPATPQVVEKEVVVEKPVVETVIVEREKVVEKPVVETVIVEKPVVHTVVVEVPAKPTPTVEPEKELVIVQGTEPQTMDMQMITAQVVVNIGHHINEPLLNYNVDMELQPHLAISWEQIEPTVWQYKLRQGVKFSNGEPFNAEQVKFSFERVMDPASTSMRKGETRWVSEVEVVDEYTVNFHTNGVVPLFDLYLSKFPIVPRGYVTEVGDEIFAREPIGTGPFILREWVKDDHITMVRNPDYWGPQPKIDILTFRTVPDIASRVATLLAGEADVVMDLQPATITEVEKRPNLTALKRPEMRCLYLKFNTRIESPLEDVRVRQAFNYAINKEAIVQTVLNGYGSVLQGQPESPEYWDFNPNLEPYPYDPEKAKELLAEAGYPDGFEIRMSCPRGRYMMDAEICQAVGGQLRDVGITLDLEIREFGVHNKEFYTQRGGPIFLVGYMSEPDAARMLSIFHSSHPNSQRANPELDKMIDAAIAETDKEKRTQLVWEALKYFREDAPVAFLHQQFLLVGVHKRVQNFEPYPDGRIYFRDVDVSGPRER